MGKKFMFRVPEGEEIVEFLTRFLVSQDIRAGIILGVGSLEDPEVGYFDREKKEYITKTLKGTYELVTLIGNVSIKNGKPFLHVHVSLGDREGKLYGGHLIRAKVFVAEIFIEELDEKLERRKFGSLYLWDPINLDSGS